MSSALLVFGSPAKFSRSSALADAIGEQLAANGIRTGALSIADVPADDLIAGRWDGPAAQRLAAKVADADALVIATPVYKASFSGSLKTLLDLLPERALDGKIVLPVATGGTLAHFLAVEYALKPVLSALGARHILSGVFAHETQIRVGEAALRHEDIDAEVRVRIEDSVEHLTELLEYVDARRLNATSTLATIALQARCSA
jgi:FMN reductase